MALKTFATGEVLQAADLNNVSRQGVINVSGISERDQIASPHEGMLVYLTDLNRYDWYNGSAWAVHGYADSGNINVASYLKSGFTSSNFTMRRSGKMVELKGSISGTYATGLVGIIDPGGIPADYRPQGNNVWASAYMGGTSRTPGIVLVRDNGSMDVQNVNASFTGAPQIYISYVIA